MNVNYEYNFKIPQDYKSSGGEVYDAVGKIFIAKQEYGYSNF